MLEKFYCTTKNEEEFNTLSNLAKTKGLLQSCGISFKFISNRSTLSFCIDDTDTQILLYFWDFNSREKFPLEEFKETKFDDCIKELLLIGSKEKEFKIGSHKIEFETGGVKVGCQSIDEKVLELIVDCMNSCNNIQSDIRTVILVSGLAISFEGGIWIKENSRCEQYFIEKNTVNEIYEEFKSRQQKE